MTLLCQFLSIDIIRDSSLAKSTLVHGFVYLVSAIDDVHDAVAARAKTMVLSINESSLKVCLYLQDNTCLSFCSLAKHAEVFCKNLRIEPN